MSSDVRKIIYGTLIGFVLLLLVWFATLFIFGCGGSIDCAQGIPTPVRTAIPTLIPATLPAPVLDLAEASGGAKCRVAAVDLLGAWINAGYPEADPFEFTDVNGQTCTGTYAEDIYFLLHEANLWYTGALACASCHNADIAAASANLNLADYQGILAGSRRASPDAAGNDILGGGVWEQSLLHEVLITRSGQPLAMPLGRPADLDILGVLVFAGSPKPVAATP